MVFGILFTIHESGQNPVVNFDYEKNTYRKKKDVPTQTFIKCKLVFYFLFATTSVIKKATES